MAKLLAEKSNTPPVEFECACGEIAQTQGLSTPPHGWKRTLAIAAFPARCVTWRCAECAKGEPKC